jgi:arylsulfatase A-like enzyme
LKPADKMIIWTLLLSVLFTCCGRREDRTSVVLISIDSLRPDHLGCYGYGRETSPAMDALAAEGTLFLNAVSTTSWTLPAHVSLLTSLYNSAHRVNIQTYRIDPNRILMASIFRKQGYRTAGFVSGPFLHPVFGFDRGFEEYHYCTPDPNASSLIEKYPISEEVQLASDKDITSPGVNSAVLPWLEKNAGRPFFLFIHYFDVHYDYIPPPSYVRMFDPDYEGTITTENFIKDDRINASLAEEDIGHIVARYDGEIRFTDDHLGAVIDKLKALGLFDKTLIILTSDHGDEFFEHGGKGHAHTLFDELIKIPLVMRYPEKIPSGRKIENQVRIIDIMPTVLDICGLPPSREQMGTSLLPLIRGNRTDAGLMSLSELYMKGHAQVSLRTNRWKVVFNHNTRKPYYFNLREDPEEQQGVLLTPSSPDYKKVKLLFRMGGKAFKIGEGLPRSADEDQRELDPATLKRLKSLGYIE